VFAGVDVMNSSVQVFGKTLGVPGVIILWAITAGLSNPLEAAAGVDLNRNE
jgi:hypothetical protein